MGEFYVEEENFLEDLKSKKYVQLNEEGIDKVVKIIEKYEHVVNKLEKELREDYKIWMCNSRSNGKSVKFGIDVCKTHFYNRLQELKGNGEE